MATCIHSDKSVGVRPQYLALGVDADGCWHNYRTDTEKIIVTSDAGIEHVEPLAGRPVEHWVAFVDDRIGWADHPDAQPGRGWLEVLAA
jgi:hypothetical protein